MYMMKLIIKNKKIMKKIKNLIIKGKIKIKK